MTTTKRQLGLLQLRSDSELKMKYLCDIYRKEGDLLLEQREYRSALKNYTQAIKTRYNQPDILLCRSRCYFKMGKKHKAMDDVDAALTLDLGHLAAVQHKAELLYQAGNYELAIIYFHRGLKQNPGNELFQAGVEKSQKALDHANPNRRMKLTAAGDLTIYLHKKSLHYGRQSYEDSLLSDRDPFRETTPETIPLRKSFQEPSAQFLDGSTPLVRINRKPGISCCRGHDGNSSLSEFSFSTADKSLSEAAIREILGALYGDKEYLEKLQTNMKGLTKTSKDVVAMTEEGLNFLQERSLFWESLGPLPPPLPTRRTYHQAKSSQVTGGGSLENMTGSIVAIPESLRAGPPTESDTAVPLDESAVRFDFKSYRPVSSMYGSSYMGTSSDFAVFSEDPNYSDVPTPDLGSWKDTDTDISAQEQRKRDVSVYFTKESDFIEQCFVKRKFSECIQRAERCLYTIDSLNDADLPDKIERVASLHSCLGNAAVAMQQYKMAEQHHLYVLQIGEQEGMQEVTSRALGNLGRMYILMRKYNKALNVLSRKVPLCRVSTEVAWCFLEIGTCFIALDHYDYARDCGKKALHAAQDANIDHYQFQSCLLLAMAEAKLKKYSESYKAFETALDMAKIKDDQETVTAITQAMEHLNRHITIIEQKNAKKQNQKRALYPKRKVFRRRHLMPSERIRLAEDSSRDVTDDEFTSAENTPREKFINASDGLDDAAKDPEIKFQDGSKLDGKDAHPGFGLDLNTPRSETGDADTDDSFVRNKFEPQHPVASPREPVVSETPVTSQTDDEVHSKPKDHLTGEVRDSDLIDNANTISIKDDTDDDVGVTGIKEEQLKEDLISDNVDSDDANRLDVEQTHDGKTHDVNQDTLETTSTKGDTQTDTKETGVHGKQNVKGIIVHLANEGNLKVPEIPVKLSPRKSMVRSADKIVQEAAKIMMVPNQQSMRFRGASSMSTNPELMTSKEMLALASQDLGAESMSMSKGSTKGGRSRRGVTIVTPIVEEDYPETEPDGLVTTDDDDKKLDAAGKKLTKKQRIALKLKRNLSQKSRFSRSREFNSKLFWNKVKHTVGGEEEETPRKDDSCLNQKVDDTDIVEKTKERGIQSRNEIPPKADPSSTVSDAYGGITNIQSATKTDEKTDGDKGDDVDNAKKAIASKLNEGKRKSHRSRSKRSRSRSGRASNLSEITMNSITEHEELSEEVSKSAETSTGSDLSPLSNTSSSNSPVIKGEKRSRSKRSKRRKSKRVKDGDKTDDPNSATDTKLESFTEEKNGNNTDGVVREEKTKETSVTTKLTKTPELLPVDTASKTEGDSGLSTAIGNVITDSKTNSPTLDRENTQGSGVMVANDELADICGDDVHLLKDEVHRTEAEKKDLTGTSVLGKMEGNYLESKTDKKSDIDLKVSSSDTDDKDTKHYVDQNVKSERRGSRAGKIPTFSQTKGGPDQQVRKTKPNAFLEQNTNFKDLKSKALIVGTNVKVVSTPRKQTIPTKHPTVSTTTPRASKLEPDDKTSVSTDAVIKSEVKSLRKITRPSRSISRSKFPTHSESDVSPSVSGSDTPRTLIGGKRSQKPTIVKRNITSDKASLSRLNKPSQEHEGRLIAKYSSVPKTKLNIQHNGKTDSGVKDDGMTDNIGISKGVDATDKSVGKDDTTMQNVDSIETTEVAQKEIDDITKPDAQREDDAESNKGKDVSEDAGNTSGKELNETEVKETSSLAIREPTAAQDNLENIQDEEKGVADKTQAQADVTEHIEGERHVFEHTQDTPQSENKHEQSDITIDTKTSITSRAGYALADGMLESPAIVSSGNQSAAPSDKSQENDPEESSDVSGNGYRGMEHLVIEKDPDESSDGVSKMEEHAIIRQDQDANLQIMEHKEMVKDPEESSDDVSRNGNSGIEHLEMVKDQMGNSDGVSRKEYSSMEHVDQDTSLQSTTVSRKMDQSKECVIPAQDKENFSPESNLTSSRNMSTVSEKTENGEDENVKNGKKSHGIDQQDKDVNRVDMPDVKIRKSSTVSTSISDKIIEESDVSVTVRKDSESKSQPTSFGEKKPYGILHKPSQISTKNDAVQNKNAIPHFTNLKHGTKPYEVKQGLKTSIVKKDASQKASSDADEKKDKPLRVTRFLITDSSDDPSEIDSITPRVKQVHQASALSVETNKPDREKSQLDIEPVSQQPSEPSTHVKRKVQLVVPSKTDTPLQENIIGSPEHVKTIQDVKNVQLVVPKSYELYSFQKPSIISSLDKTLTKRTIDQSKVKHSPRNDLAIAKTIYQPQFSLQREKSKDISPWAVRHSRHGSRMDKDLALRRSKSEGITTTKPHTARPVRSASTGSKTSKQKLSRQKRTNTPRNILLHAFGTPRKIVKTPVKPGYGTPSQTPRQKTQTSIASLTMSTPSQTPRQKTDVSLRSVSTPRQKTDVSLTSAPTPRQKTDVSLTSAPTPRQKTDVSLTSTPTPRQKTKIYGSSKQQVYQSPTRIPRQKSDSRRQAFQTPTPREKTDTTITPRKQALHQLETLIPKYSKQDKTKDVTISPRKPLKDEYDARQKYKNMKQLEIGKRKAEESEAVSPRISKKEEEYKTKKGETGKQKEVERTGFVLKGEQKKKPTETKTELLYMGLSKPGFQAPPTIKLFQKLQGEKLKDMSPSTYEKLTKDRKRSKSRESEKQLGIFTKKEPPQGKPSFLDKFYEAEKSFTRSETKSPERKSSLSVKSKEKSYSPSKPFSRSRSGSTSQSPGRPPISPGRTKPQTPKQKFPSFRQKSRYDADLHLNLDYIGRLETETTDEFFERLNQIEEETLKCEMDKMKREIGQVPGDDGQPENTLESKTDMHLDLRDVGGPADVRVSKSDKDLDLGDETEDTGIYKKDKDFYSDDESEEDTPDFRTNNDLDSDDDGQHIKLRVSQTEKERSDGRSSRKSRYEEFLEQERMLDIEQVKENESRRFVLPKREQEISPGENTIGADDAKMDEGISDLITKEKEEFVPDGIDIKELKPEYRDVVDKHVENEEQIVLPDVDDKQSGTEDDIKERTREIVKPDEDLSQSERVVDLPETTRYVTTGKDIQFSQSDTALDQPGATRTEKEKQFSKSDTVLDQTETPRSVTSEKDKQPDRVLDLHEKRSVTSHKEGKRSRQSIIGIDYSERTGSVISQNKGRLSRTSLGKKSIHVKDDGHVKRRASVMSHEGKLSRASFHKGEYEDDRQTGSVLSHAKRSRRSVASHNEGRLSRSVADESNIEPTKVSMADQRVGKSPGILAIQEPIEKRSSGILTEQEGKPAAVASDKKTGVEGVTPEQREPPRDLASQEPREERSSGIVKEQRVGESPQVTATQEPRVDYSSKILSEQVGKPAAIASDKKIGVEDVISDEVIQEVSKDVSDHRESDSILAVDDQTTETDNIKVLMAGREESLSVIADQDEQTLDRSKEYAESIHTNKNAKTVHRIPDQNVSVEKDARDAKPSDHIALNEHSVKAEKRTDSTQEYKPDVTALTIDTTQIKSHEKVNIADDVKQIDKQTKETVDKDVDDVVAADVDGVAAVGSVKDKNIMSVPGGVPVDKGIDEEDIYERTGDKDRTSKQDVLVSESVAGSLTASGIAPSSTRAPSEELENTIKKIHTDSASLKEIADTQTTTKTPEEICAERTETPTAGTKVIEPEAKSQDIEYEEVQEIKTEERSDIQDGGTSVQDETQTIDVQKQTVFTDMKTPALPAVCDEHVDSAEAIKETDKDQIDVNVEAEVKDEILQDVCEEQTKKETDEKTETLKDEIDANVEIEETKDDLSLEKPKEKETGETDIEISETDKGDENQKEKETDEKDVEKTETVKDEIDDYIKTEEKPTEKETVENDIKKDDTVKDEIDANIKTEEKPTEKETGEDDVSPEKPNEKTTDEKDAEKTDTEQKTDEKDAEKSDTEKKTDEKDVEKTDTEKKTDEKDAEKTDTEKTKEKKKRKDKPVHIPRGEVKFEKDDGRETRRYGRREFYQVVEDAMKYNFSSDEEAAVGEAVKRTGLRRTDQGRWSYVTRNIIEENRILEAQAAEEKAKVLLQEKEERRKARREKKRQRKLAKAAKEQTIDETGTAATDDTLRSRRHRKSKLAKQDTNITEERNIDIGDVSISASHQIGDTESALLTGRSEKDERRKRRSRREKRNRSGEPGFESVHVGSIERKKKEEAVSSTDDEIERMHQSRSKHSKRKYRHSSRDSDQTSEALKDRKGSKHEKHHRSSLHSRRRNASREHIVSQNEGKEKMTENVTDKQERRHRRSRHSRRDRSSASREFISRLEDPPNSQLKTDDVEDNTDKYVRRHRRSRHSRRERSSVSWEDFPRSVEPSISQLRTDTVDDDYKYNERRHRKSRRKRSSVSIEPNRDTIQRSEEPSTGEPRTDNAGDNTDKYNERRRRGSRLSRRERSNVSWENVPGLPEPSISRIRTENVDEHNDKYNESRHRRSRHFRRERSSVSIEQNTPRWSVEQDAHQVNDDNGDKYEGYRTSRHSRRERSSMSQENTPRLEELSTNQVRKDAVDDNDANHDRRRRHSRHHRRESVSVSQENTPRLTEPDNDANHDRRRRDSRHRRERSSLSLEHTPRPEGSSNNQVRKDVDDNDATNDRRHRRRHSRRGSVSVSQENTPRLEEPDNDANHDRRRRHSRHRRERSSLSQDNTPRLEEPSNNQVKTDAVDDNDATNGKIHRRRHSRRESVRMSQENTPRPTEPNNQVKTDSVDDNDATSGRIHRRRHSRRESVSLSQENTPRLEETPTNQVRKDAVDAANDDRRYKRRHSRRESISVSQDILGSEQRPSSQLKTDMDPSTERRHMSRHSRQERSSLSFAHIPRSEVPSVDVDVSSEMRHRSRHSITEHSSMSRDHLPRLELSSSLVRADTVGDDDEVYSDRHRRRSILSRRDRSSMSHETIPRLELSSSQVRADTAGDDNELYSDRNRRRSILSRRERSSVECNAEQFGQQTGVTEEANVENSEGNEHETKHQRGLSREERNREQRASETGAPQESNSREVTDEIINDETFEKKDEQSETECSDIWKESLSQSESLDIQEGRTGGSKKTKAKSVKGKRPKISKSSKKKGKGSGKK